MKTEVIASAKRRAPFNPWLRAALAFLIVVDLLVILVGLASIPIYVERAATGTIEAFELGVSSVSNEIVAEKAQARGMTPATYALYDSIVGLAFALLVTAVGLFTLWRARDQWFGWLTAHIMLFLASWSLNAPVQAAHLVPRVWTALPALSWPLFVLYFYLFPDGRAVPRWARWIVAVYLPIHLAAQFLAVLISAFPDLANKINIPGILEPLQLVIMANLVFLLGCQTYRYLRVSTPTQKLQTKWFLYGFALFLGLSSLIEWIWSSGNVPLELTFLPMAFLPITLAIAILRYRLWDIDVIIRRTLVYAIVTALLALVFYGGVVVLQSMFTGVSGQSSPVALVASTLAIAALFTPLRRHVQNFVDRRFYRGKYDALQVMARFSGVARDETDIEELSAAFVGAVRETLQPVTADIWLNPSGGKR